MSLAVATAAELAAHEARIAKLERLAELDAPSGFVRGRDLPGGPRRWRRLRERRKIVGYRIDGRGREFFFRVEDVAALMIPAPVVETVPEPKAPVETEDAKAYADARLSDLLRGGGTRAA